MTKTKASAAGRARVNGEVTVPIVVEGPRPGASAGRSPAAIAWAPITQSLLPPDARGHATVSWLAGRRTSATDASAASDGRPRACRQADVRMGKQEDFVLRALEERDVRFVRLWFTDVLGFLKSVAVAPAELEGAFEEGIGFDGSAIEGLARVYEADMLAQARPVDVPDPAVARRGAAGDGADVLRHRDARRLPVVRRPAPRPQAHAERRGRQGLHVLHAPRDRVLPVQGPPEPGEEPVPVDRSGFFDHTAQSTGADFRREAISMLEAMGISVEFSHHEGGPGQQEIDLRYADALSTADNIMTFRTVIREVALEPGHLGHLHAQALHHPPRARACTRTSRSSRATATPSTRPAPSTSSPRPAASSSPASCATPARSASSPTSGSTPTSGCSAAARRRRTICWGHNNRSAMVRVPMYKPNKGQSTRIELRTIDAACNPYLAFAVIARRRHEGHRGGLRAAARGRGRRLVAHRARAQGARHRSRCPRACTTRSAIAEDSELLAETLGEHVFDFFLRNKRAEWEEYRGQVSAFERDRMLPVL